LVESAGSQQQRLSPGTAILAIFGLSLLAWALVLPVAIALRAACQYVLSAPIP
jgi:hypothetical protein